MDHQPQCAQQHDQDGPCFTDSVSWGGLGSAFVEFSDTGPIVLPDIPPGAGIPLHDGATDFCRGIAKLAEDIVQPQTA